MKNRYTVGSSALDSSPAFERPVAYSSRAADTLVDDFLATMPERYRQEFGWQTARQHARIAAERGNRPVHADLFSRTIALGPGICVVAPDAPGLLSVISTGLMLEGFDVTRADAYTRRIPTGSYEAVDLFWVRRSPPEQPSLLGDTEVASLRSTLLDLLSHDNVRGRLQTALAGVSPGASETSVRFRSVRGAPHLTLELESNDRPGLLAIVAAALASEGVQIMDSRIRTHGLRVHDYFDIVEPSGLRPAGARLQRIQLAVLMAVDGPNQGM